MAGGLKILQYPCGSYLMYAGSGFLVRCTISNNELTCRGCVVFSSCSFLSLADMLGNRNLQFGE